MEKGTANEEDSTALYTAQYLEALDLIARYLTVRDHSRYELRTKLSRKYAPEIVERAVVGAEDRGWLGNEAELTERAVLAWRRKLKSEEYICSQLRKRGLPLPQPDTHAELETARRLLLKKFGEDLDFETKAQAARYLQNRGFTDQIIRMALDGTDDW
jgi:SOS response regulatory protein OraA/RecX